MSNLPPEMDELRDVAMLTGMLNSDIKAKNQGLVGSSEKLAMAPVDIRKVTPNVPVPNVPVPRPPSIDIPTDLSQIPPSAPLIPMDDIFAGGIPTSLAGRIGGVVPNAPAPAPVALPERVYVGQNPPPLPSQHMPVAPTVKPEPPPQM